MSSTKENQFHTPRSESYRKKDYNSSTSDIKRSSRSLKVSLSGPEDCLFCADDFQKDTKLQFYGMVNKALYSKYSSSQNYYYTKDINEILADSRTTAVIAFKDALHYDEEDEYLKRFYNYSEYDFKIKMLTEYYKFHNDIARVFMTPVSNVLNKFHDKKRRLEYIRVTKMLKDQGEGEGEVDEDLDTLNSPKEKKDPKDYLITDRILDELDITDTSMKKHKRSPSTTKKPSQPYLGKSPTQQDNKTTAKKTGTITKNAQAAKNSVSKKTTNIEPTKDASISTIKDLNLKLGEIINSRSHLDSRYLENTELFHNNETLSNLSHFLLFMDKSPHPSKMNDIPKINVKNSAPLTERSRPDSAMNTNRQKYTPRGGDLMSKVVNEHLSKPSPTISRPYTAKQSTKTSAERQRNEEKDKVVVHTLTKHKSTSSISEKPKAVPAVSKIKNFEEAIKINLQNSHKTIHASLPRENNHPEKISSGKNTARVQSSKVSSSKPKGAVTSRESSISKQRVQHQPQQQYNSSAAASSRPTSRAKSKGNDMYSKALDLLLGNNQILLATKGTKRESTSYTNRSAKNSFNVKLKNSRQDHLSHERSLGREDFKVDTGMIISNKLSSSSSSKQLERERIYMQTDRESKKIGTMGSIDLSRKEMMNIPMTEREILQRSKDYNTKGIIKAIIPISHEVENLKPGFAAYAEPKKVIHHKYTKSEGRLKKPEYTEKVDMIHNAKVIMATNSTAAKPGKVAEYSPRRQNYTYNHNNIVNVFLNANHDKRFERTITVKTDRRQDQHDHHNLYNDSDSLSKAFKSRSPNTDMMSKYSQSKKFNHELDYRNMDYTTPMRGLQSRDGFTTNHTRMLSDRSPLSISQGFQRKNNNSNSRGEFETLRRDLRFDGFESLGSRSKDKL